MCIRLCALWLACTVALFAFPIGSQVDYQLSRRMVTNTAIFKFTRIVCFFLPSHECRTRIQDHNRPILQIRGVSEANWKIKIASSTYPRAESLENKMKFDQGSHVNETIHGSLGGTKEHLLIQYSNYALHCLMSNARDLT